MVYDDRDDKRNISKKIHTQYTVACQFIFFYSTCFCIFTTVMRITKNSIKTDRPFYSFGRAWFLRVLSH